jgi:hypothetical protein
MILASVIHSRILSKLDAEGSQRYTFDEDTKYAINSAMEELISWLNEAFGEKKLAPENLRELTKVKVWKANSYSRVSFNSAEVGHELWSIISVFPKPVVNKKSAVPAGGSDSESKFCPDVSFIGGAKPAKRLTHEQWADGENNAFMSGNSVLQGELAEYAYLDFSDYSSTTYPGNADKNEITIRPDVSNEFVAIGYLKYPNQVSAIGDSIEFPKSLTELITEIALSKIAEKQGEAPTIQISTQNVNRLVSLIK